MSLFRRGNVWWYEFWFANRRVRESAKTTSKTLAKAAEQTRRRALESGFNNLEDAREERVRTNREIADDYLESYRLRNPRSPTLAEYAVGHVTRTLDDKMLVDVNEQTVKHYQDARLRENTAPRSINEEVGFLLRLMDAAGDVLRVRLRKKNLLKLKTRARIAKIFNAEEKARLTETAAKARSPHLYPALMLVLNTRMRDPEMKNLTWASGNDAQNRLAQSPQESRRSRPLARQLAHAHHGPGRERRKRSNHHGYRRARIEANAQALQPYPHGREPCRARIHCSKANRHAEP